MLNNVLLCRVNTPRLRRARAGRGRRLGWRHQPTWVVHCADEPAGMAPLERRPTKSPVVGRRSSGAGAGRLIGSGAGALILTHTVSGCPPAPSKRNFVPHSKTLRV